jgi:CheY-like chemotaxis protein
MHEVSVGADRDRREATALVDEQLAPRSAREAKTVAEIGRVHHSRPVDGHTVRADHPGEPDQLRRDRSIAVDPQMRHHTARTLAEHDVHSAARVRRHGHTTDFVREQGQRAPLFRRTRTARCRIQTRDPPILALVRSIAAGASRHRQHQCQRLHHPTLPHTPVIPAGCYLRSVKKILVVEDDPVIAKVLRDFLQANGYRISQARSGDEGVARFILDEPDLMLVDVLLPKKNGFEVCFEVRRTPRGKNVPLLLMSAVYTDVDHAARYASEELRASGYLVKPFELTSLLSEVKRLLGEPRLLPH